MAKSRIRASPSRTELLDIIASAPSGAPFGKVIAVIARQLVDTLKPGDWAELSPKLHPRIFGCVISVKSTIIGTEVIWRVQGEQMDNMSIFPTDATVLRRTSSRRHKNRVVR